MSIDTIKTQGNTLTFSTVPAGEGLKRALAMSRVDIIDIAHLPRELRPGGPGSTPISQTSGLRALEQDVIAQTLKRCQGNRRRTAAELGIDPSTLYRKLKALNIAVPEKDGRSRRQ